jgi:hypothetical protein
VYVPAKLSGGGREKSHVVWPALGQAPEVRWGIDAELSLAVDDHVGEESKLQEGCGLDLGHVPLA